MYLGAISAYLWSFIAVLHSDITRIIIVLLALPLSFHEQFAGLCSLVHP
jgi:hypothetical protein